MEVAPQAGACKGAEGWKKAEFCSAGGSGTSANNEE